MATMNVIQAITAALHAEMQRDQRVIIIGEDVGRLGGVFQATVGLAQEFGSQRVIDAPLAESSIVGIAIGAATSGLLPVAEIQFADFIYPAVDQIINEAARIRYRTANGYGCPLVIRAPYGVVPGGGGGLYHSQSVESLFVGTPGLKIVAPCTPYDVKGLLIAAIRDPDPILFLEHKATYRGVKGEVPEDDYTLPIGRADVKREGSDVSVITYGLMVHHALVAAARLAEENIFVEVVDLRTLQPLDYPAIAKTVQKTGKVLVAHEANVTGGLGAEVAAFIADECLFYLDAPIKRLASPDVPLAPFHHNLEEQLVPNEDTLVAAIRSLARF